MDAIIELFQSEVTITPKPFNRSSIIKQNWSLPDSIIYYITKYPSNSKGYQKLIQSCKYFFFKNPIIVASSLRSKHVSKALICSKMRKDCENNDGKCCIEIDIKNVTSKIWITGKFEISFDAPTSLICSKLYKCETYLGHEYKNIFFDDFKFLASPVKRICLSKSSIKYKDGEIVMLEKILECLPNIKRFHFDFAKLGEDTSMVNDSTLKNIMKLKNLKNLQFFILNQLSEIFPVEELYAFIKKFKNTRIGFHFNDNLSEEYKEQLDELIDEIIESNVPVCVIRYKGQDEEKYKDLESFK